MKRDMFDTKAEYIASQIVELAEALEKLDVQKVVSSPYLRCLATASKLCHALDPGIAQIEIDYSLSEVRRNFSFLT